MLLKSLVLENPQLAPFCEGGPTGVGTRLHRGEGVVQRVGSDPQHQVSLVSTLLYQSRRLTWHCCIPPECLGLCVQLDCLQSPNTSLPQEMRSSGFAPFLQQCKVSPALES